MPYGTKRRYGTSFGHGVSYGRAGKRAYSGYRKGMAQRPVSRVSSFRPGKDRVGGYYGRFAGGSAQEHKFLDLNINDASIVANGNIAEDSIFGIAQGVTESTRIGRKAVIRAINWRFNIELLAAALATGTETVRVILYQDKQCNGATAAITDVVESNNFQSFNNLANKGRFRTLMDRTYSLNHHAATGDGAANDAVPFTINDSFYYKCTMPVEYDSTTGAITEIRSNNVGVLLLSDIGDLAGFTSKMRVRFTDS